MNQTKIKKYLFETMNLQYLFNSIVNDNWINQKDYKWDVSMFVEIGEMLASTGYKHWKNEPFDLENIKMEIVDVYHFWLSWGLVKTLEDNDSYSNKTNEISKEQKNDLVFQLLDKTENILNEYYNLNPLQYNPLILDHKHKEHFTQLLKKYSFEFTKNLIDNNIEESFKSLISLIHVCFVDFEEFYSLYLAKNALNKFRQSNGYKNGTYKKIWHSNLEDNYHVSNIIKNIKELEEFENYLNLEYILEKMTIEYKK